MNAIRFLTGIALGLAAAQGAWGQGAASGSGQTYPSKPVRLISPYPPGGGTDAVARILAQALSDQLGSRPSDATCIARTIRAMHIIGPRRTL